MPEENEKPKRGRPTPKKEFPRAQLTQERCDKFLEVYAQTGSKTAAARAATPHGKGKKPGYSTFQREERVNPEFKAAVEEAHKEYLGFLNQTIHDRAFNPTTRPIFSQGQLVGEELKYDNQLLMKVAKRHEPEKWSEKQQIEHTGQINHGVMVVAALPASEEEWEDQYTKALPEADDEE